MKKNKNIITSKLLSEVLGREVKEGKGRIVINDNLVTFAYIDEDMWSDINIHELAFKCKEWAVNEHDIYISTVAGEDRKSGVFYTSSFKFKNIRIDLYECTEPEVIFSSCDHILGEL